MAVSNPNNKEVPKTVGEVAEKLAGVTEQLNQFAKSATVSTGNHRYPDAHTRPGSLEE
jgi:hypothetical protein